MKHAESIVGDIQLADRRKFLIDLRTLILDLYIHVCDNQPSEVTQDVKEQTEIVGQYAEALKEVSGFTGRPILRHLDITRR